MIFSSMLLPVMCKIVQSTCFETGTNKGKTVPLKIDYIGVAYVISGFANSLEMYSFSLFAVSDMGFRS